MKVFKDRAELIKFLDATEICGSALSVLTPAGPLVLYRVKDFYANGIVPGYRGFRFFIDAVGHSLELHRWIFGV